MQAAASKTPRCLSGDTIAERVALSSADPCWVAGAESGGQGPPGGSMRINPDDRAARLGDRGKTK